MIRNKIAVTFGLFCLAFFGLASAQSNNNSSSRNAGDYVSSDVVTLRFLDKLVGRATDSEIPVNQPVNFGALRVVVKACYYRPPELPPEDAAFIQIEKTAEEGISLPEPESVFSGWMFSSSPGLSALEHPVYDVWIISCKAKEPEVGTTGAEN